MLSHFGPGGKFKQLRYFWVLHKKVSSMIQLMGCDFASQVAKRDGHTSALVPSVQCNDPVEC
eukprot:7372321-Prorocentrum_lima.AAC.1